jgi:hypothetical protein
VSRHDRQASHADIRCEEGCAGEEGCADEEDRAGEEDRAEERGSKSPPAVNGTA